MPLPEFRPPPLFRPLRRWKLSPRWSRWLNSLPFHILLFAATVLTTLVVGTHIALNYARNLPAFDWDVSPEFFSGVLHRPSLLALGLPFSATLLSILLAHELGHYFTCKSYGIRGQLRIQWRTGE